MCIASGHKSLTGSMSIPIVPVEDLEAMKTSQSSLKAPIMRALYLAALICVLLTAGVLTGFHWMTPSASNAPQVSSRPSLSSLLQASTVDCNTTDMPQCLDRLTPAIREVCLGCVNALTANASSCDVFGDDFCTDLQVCPCGSCDHALHAWVQCQVPQCDLCTLEADDNDCLSGPLLSCLRQSDFIDLDACLDCIDSTEDERAALFCPSYEPCQNACADCSDDVVEFANCVFQEEVPCDGFVAPMDYPVPDISCGQDYTQCFQGRLTAVDTLECINCINAAVSDTFFVPDFCAAECPACGPCIDQVNLYVTCSIFGSSTVCESTTVAPTPAPTVDECADEASTVYSLCVVPALSSGAEECFECYGNALETSLSVEQVFKPCAAVNDEVCPLALDCPCLSGCMEAFQEQFNCGIGIPDCLDCSSFFTNAPAETPAESPVPLTPTALGSCDVVESRYKRCIDDAFRAFFDQQACYDCVNAASRDAPRASCEDFNDFVCPSFRQCDKECGECLPAAQDWLDCSVGGDSCTVDCGDLEVIPQAENAATQCRLEEITYENCLRDDFATTAERNQCVDCINAGLTADAETCDVFISELCPQLRQCDAVCASCLPFLNEWYNCAVGGVSCKIDCLDGV